MIYQGVSITVPEDTRTRVEKVRDTFFGTAITDSTENELRVTLKKLYNADELEGRETPERNEAKALVFQYLIEVAHSRRGGLRKIN